MFQACSDNCNIFEGVAYARAVAILTQAFQTMKQEYDERISKLEALCLSKAEELNSNSN